MEIEQLSHETCSYSEAAGQLNISNLLGYIPCMQTLKWPQNPFLFAEEPLKCGMERSGEAHSKNVDSV